MGCNICPINPTTSVINDRCGDTLSMELKHLPNKLSEVMDISKTSKEKFLYVPYAKNWATAGPVVTVWKLRHARNYYI